MNLNKINNISNMETLKNKKVYIGKFPKEIQKKAFKLGWSWRNDNSIKFDYTFIYFHSDKFMSHENSLFNFNTHYYEEVTPEWILNLPEKKDKSWERLGLQITGFHVFEKEIASVNIKGINFSKESEEFDVYNILPSKKEAEAYRVLPKLLYWRDFYNENWKPDWNNSEETKYCIECFDNTITTIAYSKTFRKFAFKTSEIRNKFLEDFKEELEIVKVLL